MERDVERMEEDFRKRMRFISSHLEDLYETISDLEQNLDLCELKILALRKKVIVPRVGFLGQYDFDQDPDLEITRNGTIRLEKLEDLKKAEISFEGDDKFAGLTQEVFLPPFEEEEMAEYDDDGIFLVPVVEVETVASKPESEDSDSDSESYSESE